MKTKKKVRVLFEVYVAMIAGLLNIVYLDMFEWFLLCCSISPLLLLRSKKSVNLGSRMFNTITTRVERQNVVHRAVFLMLLPIISLLIRISSTVIHFKHGIRNFADNWKSEIWQKSVFENLEFVPGTGEIRTVVAKINVGFKGLLLFFLLNIFAVYAFVNYFVQHSSYLSNLKAGTQQALLDGDWLSVLVYYFILLLIFVVPLYAVGASVFAASPWGAEIIGYFCAIIYRFSLKSTALFWLPLCYSLRDTYRYDVELERRLESYKSSTGWELIRAVSISVIFLFVIKVVLLPTASSLVSDSDWHFIVSLFLTPGHYRDWQLASLLNAVMALVFYYGFIDLAIRNLETKKWKNESIEKVCNIFGVIRALLTIYTLPALFVISFYSLGYISTKFEFVRVMYMLERPSELFNGN